MASIELKEIVFVEMEKDDEARGLLAGVGRADRDRAEKPD